MELKLRLTIEKTTGKSLWIVPIGIETPTRTAHYTHPQKLWIVPIGIETRETFWSLQSLLGSELYLLELKLEIYYDILVSKKLWIVPIGIETLQVHLPSVAGVTLNCTYWNWNVISEVVLIPWFFSELYLLELKHVLVEALQNGVGSELYLLELKLVYIIIFKAFTCSELYLLELKLVCFFYNQIPKYLWIVPIGIETY